MKQVRVRFNHGCTDGVSFWRVFVDGEEFLASSVSFNVPTWTSRDEEPDGSFKFHISCECTNIRIVGITWIIE